MKHSITRVLSLLLVLVLAVGLLPMAALAGPDVETVYVTYSFVTYPLAGNHPNLTGYARYDSEPYVVDEVHFFELDGGGYPMGKFLDESYTFEAGRTYACQVLMYPKSGYEFDKYSLACVVNGRQSEDVSVLPDGMACATVYFDCVDETVTLSFDPNGSKDSAPTPLQVPVGATLWDVIRNPEAVDMPSQPWEQFLGWSTDPFATTNEALFPTENPISEDMTLYAAWRHCEQTVELFVEVPSDCFVNDVGEAIITVPETAGYAAIPDFFYAAMTDGYLHPDLIYNMPFQKGATYYSHAIVQVNMAGNIPEVKLHGADLISVKRNYDWELEVIFSVTPGKGDKLTKASVAINTPRAGQNAIAHHPEVISLTPGVNVGVMGWFDSPELGTEIYDGTLEGGKTYYALIHVGDDTGNYSVSANSLQLDVLGDGVKLVRMVDISDAMPNYAGALVAVTIPKSFTFVAEVKYGGGKIRSDREPQKWVTLMDFSGSREGPITMEAKADPDHLFKGWIDLDTYEYVSKKPVYTFNLDRDTQIRAMFVKKPPFDDVGAWDYFYEPVMWAIQHDPIITGGVGNGKFGVNMPCTREQIVTFLWKANGEPKPETTTCPFSDVKPGKYYYDAVLWANENHITGGIGNGQFGVGTTCTRAQAMTFLWAASGAPEPNPVEESPFIDVKEGKYYYKPVLWAIQHEPAITGGVGGGCFGVDMTCSRAQIITFLYKVYGPKG